MLLRHVTGLDRTRLFLALRDPADPDVQHRFDALVSERADGIPIAYLTGQREFMGMTFQVDSSTLIPRPETELLVEWAIAVLRRLPHRPVRAVDVGAGSGAIAVAIAARAPQPLAMTAIEPSADARKIIAQNADRLLPPDRRLRLQVQDGDLLAETPGPYDLIVANLPYLTPKQIAENPNLAAEPRAALDGGHGGLELIDRLIGQLPSRTASACAVGLEIDPSQAEHVSALLGDTLPRSIVSTIQDYAGHVRHVVATRLAP